VEIPHLYNPIVAYGEVRMLMTHAQLRKDRDLPIPNKGKDSEYAHHDAELD